MTDYIVTVKYKVGTGYTELTKSVWVIKDTMKQAKHDAMLIVGKGIFEIVSVTAHKVKVGEEIPAHCSNWLYE